MSWWWSSSKPKAATASPEAQTDVKAELPTLPSTTMSQPESQSRTPTQALSREELATQELNELLKMFQDQSETDRDTRIKTKETGSSTAPPIPADISPDSVYPTEMSCRSSLDYAMFCQSFGGQFVNVYRYGEFRSCSNHWQDFWLCMRTRNWDPKDRSKAVQDHYKNKAIKWKTGPSSEDIWEVRQEPVKDAFQGNLEELEAKIAEWKQANPDVPDPWGKQSAATFSNPAPGSS